MKSYTKMCENAAKTIGVWMSDKKSQKLNWKEFNYTCKLHGYKLLRVDIEKPIEEQGNIDVFLHKLVNIIAAADQGDAEASSTLSRVELYLSNHPHVTVIDPLVNVKILLNRMNYYSILEAEQSFKSTGIFTPAFVEFTRTNIDENLGLMRRKGVRFPVICKPTVAHGSKSAHEMVVIFNKRGLRVCKPPCVVQNFVNHNAVLHKVFLVGNRYQICERPSLKNFYPSEDLEPIFYSTGEVCKADSQSTLSILDPHDQPDADSVMSLDEGKVRRIIRVLTKKIGLLLTGFDVVIDNTTGNHAVIDINVYPSYDNFPNYFEHLLNCIDEMVDSKNEGVRADSNIANGHSTYDRQCNGLINVATNASNIRVIGMNVTN